jgi:hypothetical protein
MQHTGGGGGCRECQNPSPYCVKDNLLGMTMGDNHSPDSKDWSRYELEAR